MNKEMLIKGLNAETKAERLNNLRELMKLYKSGEIEMPVSTDNVNNHIHTTYSFSPYSPTMAVYKAWIVALQPQELWITIRWAALRSLLRRAR